MNPLWLFLVPAAFIAGFYANAYLTKGTIAMITADFQAQIDRLNASAAAEAEKRQAAIDAAVAAATAEASTNAADNLAGVTAAADAVASAVGA